ncbi:SDR family oxidoreductase [Galactobacter caseinivorans]|uniref:SDR family NAD(P)-dependent oxidoreductase n=1 Tax=Galactobacter caseinivorans TaxID=2676123 RepID=A0A496PH07_9MICC|nr:SDR family oxidoreductase [Galactobacter caseinivorans]RKW69768.1 SDR family NAD(P)-dependent oxidoreductase [Galactobacter caseinivorans]
MTDAATPRPATNQPLRPQPARSALVTGASAGIGAATVRALRSQGWDVVAVARRRERLQALAEETGCAWVDGDVSQEADVERMRQAAAAHGVSTLINIAGGARGNQGIAQAKSEDWEWMFQANVMGSMQLTRALLPLLRAAEGGGTVLNLTSTAALSSYEGGGGYNAAKAAQSAMTQALRLEEAEHGVRVVEVLPGMVRSDEFALRRLGSQEAADAVYAGVQEPLSSEDVADVVRYAVSVPQHVNLDQIVLRPVAQAANHKVIRRH